MTISLDDLAYLHDARVVEMSFSTENDGLKHVMLRVTCHDDCGHVELNGRTLDVLFRDTLLVQGQLLGHAIGDDEVNGLDQGIGSDAMTTIEALVASGIAAPTIMLTLTLHSGSELSIACGSVDIRPTA